MSRVFEKIMYGLMNGIAGTARAALVDPCPACRTETRGLVHIECANAACPFVHPSSKGIGLNAPRAPSIFTDPDPTILSQLIECGKAEVQR